MPLYTVSSMCTKSRIFIAKAFFINDACTSPYMTGITIKGGRRNERMSGPPIQSDDFMRNFGTELERDCC